LMTSADIGFAQRLTAAERWGYLKRDFEDLIAFEPGGCFVARAGERRVGIVTSTSYGTYAFVGSLIVEESHRNTGIGKRLLEHAIAYLQGKGVRTIELDGVFRAASLYRRLGFKDKYLSLRFFRPPTGRAAAGKAMLREGPDDILEFDLMRTGIRRERIIRHYFKHFGESAFILMDDGVRAYAFARPRGGGDMGIGPFVAEDDRAAERLISEIERKYSEVGVSIGVPEDKRSMVELLKHLGFQYRAPSLRMYRGDRKAYENHVYGILSPEKG